MRAARMLAPLGARVLSRGRLAAVGSPLSAIASAIGGGGEGAGSNLQHVSTLQRPGIFELASTPPVHTAPFTGAPALAAVATVTCISVGGPISVSPFRPGPGARSAVLLPAAQHDALHGLMRSSSARLMHAEAPAALFQSSTSGRPTAPVFERAKLSTAVDATPSGQGRPELLTATRACLAHCSPSSLQLHRRTTSISQRSFSTAIAVAGQQRSIDLMSSSFLTMRQKGIAYVDKTGAIVDVLANDNLSYRAFFPRPRRFGKSLTIGVMAEMCAAGKLPEGVAPWPGFVDVNIDRVFGGLEVHERWKQGDAAARSVLDRAHFVIKLPLGNAQTGSKLEQSIIWRVADIAGLAFGRALRTEILQAPTCGAALDALICVIPEAVPVAVLVDEYDQAIINDVAEEQWAAAKQGLAALRSLMMISKAQGPDGRIERFIVTGATRFARTSLFSGANNFVDLSAAPEASRMLGFTEQEIRSNFPVELARLGQHEAARLGCAAATAAAQQDVAIRALENWYSGYCFGTSESTYYNPAPVLAALAAGKITAKEMEGAASFSWLGLAPSAVLDHAFTRAVRATVQTFDIADLRKQTVNATALLLQTGLLSLQPMAGSAADDAHVTLQAPNEYARNTLLHLVAEISALRHEVVAADALRIRKAVSTRNHDDFSACLRELLASIPYAMAKMKPGAASEAPPPREAPYHTCVYGFLRAALPHNLCNILVEQQSAFGSADIVLELKKPGFEPISDVWIVEVGAVTPAANRSLGLVLKDKAKQVRAYYARYASLPGRVAALVVDRDAEEVSVQWQEWDVIAQRWK